MRSFELKTTIKPLASCLAFYALISTAVASPQYQQVADDIARQAQVLGAQIPVPHASEGPLPSVLWTLLIPRNTSARPKL